MKYIFIGLISLFLLTPTVFAADDMATPGSTLREKIRENRKEIKTERMEIRADRKETRIENREAAKTLFKQKLAAFKDKVKAERVDRISSLFTTINANRTSQMQKDLEKMTTILTKIQTHLEDFQKQGKDTSTIETARSEAQAAVTSATEAVKAQAAKEYTITVSSESTVKSDVATVRNTMESDVKAVREQVVAARKKVAAVISQTEDLMGELTNGK